jgi:diguanylate cyclase (GGDEF)-like protein
MADGTGKPTILIVDDIPLNIKILGDSLKKDYRVRFATEGPKALAIAASDDQPDLILLDIVMPVMDGYEVCRRLKANRHTRNIPVIFITAKDQEEDETAGLEIGAVDYITKPFSLPIVNARIHTHLELKRHRDFLENLSTLDGLTGVPNRRTFDERLRMEWRRAIRESTSLALLIMDIDHFKAFNDNYGHLAGDDCLKLVARNLAATINRPGDFFARYGGEEFTCILPLTDLNGVRHMAGKMLSRIESLKIPHRYSSVGDHVTISIGGACIYPIAPARIDMLIEAADKSLYEAKKEGRNCIRTVDVSFALREVETKRAYCPQS